MKRMTKILSLALAIMLIAAMALPVSAFAVYEKPTSNNTLKFQTALVVEKDASIPRAQFEYTIAAGTAVTTSTLRVLAGLGTPTVGNATFTPTSTTTAGASGNPGVSSNYKYATADVTVDFSSVAFNEPGVYRYTLTQTAPSTPYSLRSSVKAARTLDVYVQVNDSDKLIIAGYVLYDDVITANAPNGGSATNKTGTNTVTDGATGPNSVAFINEMSSNTLTFAANVTGNQGSSDKYFKYSVEITGMSASAKVTVSGAVAEPEKSSATTYAAADMKTANNVTELTADTTGKITHDFYLKKSDVVSLKGLPQGSHYTITVEAEDYTATAGATISSTTYTTATNGTMGTDEVKTGYTLNRVGAVPTGVILTLAPFAAIMVLGAVGIGFVLARKKRVSD